MAYPHPESQLPTPVAPTPPPGLRRVIALLIANLGLSALLTVAVFALRRSVVDYQLAHTHVPAGADVEALRQTMQTAVWFRVGGVLIVSIVYVFLIRRLQAGSRGAYRRVMFISAAGLIAIGVVLLQNIYPAWMRVEQVLQALVLAALLWATQQADVKRFFAKRA